MTAPPEASTVADTVQLRKTHGICRSFVAFSTFLCSFQRFADTKQTGTSEPDWMAHVAAWWREGKQEPGCGDEGIDSTGKDV